MAAEAATARPWGKDEWEIFKGYSRLTGMFLFFVLFHYVCPGHWYDIIPFGIGLCTFGSLSVAVLVSHYKN
jgi:hypothetical protein